MVSNGIVIQNLSKHFQDIKAIDNLEIEIAKGNIVGLLGPNGAGKTTLIRLLCGIMRPDTGCFLLYDFNSNSNLEDIKRLTGLLPEEAALYDKLSIKEYAEFIGSLYGLDRETIRIRFEKLSTRLEIYQLKDRLIETLSKGQKQKVSLIVALLHEPNVLLLDEPMANLDVVAQREVKKIIQEYKSQDRIIIIASHLLDNIKATCDEVIVINKGTILKKGPIQSIFNSDQQIEDQYLQLFGGD